MCGLALRQRKLARIGAMWDMAFKKVTGDKVYLLTGPSGLGERMIHGYGSNGPAGTKWIVTKATRSGEDLLCWCIPVEVAPGPPVVVKLSEENLFDLEELYDQATAPPAAEK